MICRDLKTQMKNRLMPTGREGFNLMLIYPESGKKLKMKNLRLEVSFLTIPKVYS